MVLFKLGFGGLGFFSFFSCVFAYRVNLFIYDVKRRGRLVKELSPKIRAAQHSTKRDSQERGHILVGDNHVSFCMSSGEPPGTDGL